MRERGRKTVTILFPDSHDLAWAAGFFDGEGCVQAYAGPSYDTSEGRKYRRYLRIDVSQKNEPLLARLEAMFEAGKVYPQKARPTSSAGFKWVCTGRVAFHVINLLWPWLGEQKKADFKRALRRILETRQDFVRHPQRGVRVVTERG